MKCMMLLTIVFLAPSLYAMRADRYQPADVKDRILDYLEEQSYHIRQSGIETVLVIALIAIMSAALTLAIKCGGRLNLECEKSKLPALVGSTLAIIAAGSLQFLTQRQREKERREWVFANTMVN